MRIGLAADLAYLIETHGEQAVKDAIVQILGRDLPEVRPEIRAWMEGRREALAAAAHKFGLLPHTAGQVKTEGRRN